MSREKNAAGGYSYGIYGIYGSYGIFCGCELLSLTSSQYVRLGDGTDELTTRAYFGVRQKEQERLKRLVKIESAAD